jgi:peroxiredoxin (alkyl hydroperoxide reductase subunit C)
MSLLNTTIPAFTAPAYRQGAFLEVTEKDLAGKWAVLFIDPAAFTPVCPTELLHLQEHYAAFRDQGVEVYAVSTDSVHSHEAWASTDPIIGRIEYTIIADHAFALSRAFDCLIEVEGTAERATFLIDPDGVIKSLEKSDGAVARKASELARKIKAAQFVASGQGRVCRATWAIEDA